MPFTKIGLCDELVQGILATGYSAPTEIQAQAIPIAIKGRDMIGCAQTGTGKTAAFVLPMLNKIAMKTKNNKLQALVLTPTRELAMQIDKSIKNYGRFIKAKSTAIYGGSSITKQTKVLAKGVNIISATPGRLIDHINRGNVDLSTVEILVLDEADRMLDMGFINDIRKIIDVMPSDRQTLLFSATMSKEINKLTSSIQKNPEMIQIGTQHNPIDTITQHIYPVAKDQKIDLLLNMINSQQMFSVLIFSRTKRGADKICRILNKNSIKTEAIHSDRTQRQRLRALDGFRSGKYQVMVATDIAARGINVNGISHVFNYDVPAYPEDYVHRIGRTGRAEATGDAITFVSEDETDLIAKIERFIDRKFKEEYYRDFNYSKIIKLDNASGKSKSKKKDKNKSGKSRSTNKNKKNYSGKPSKKTNKYKDGSKRMKKTKKKS